MSRLCKDLDSAQMMAKSLSILHDAGEPIPRHVLGVVSRLSLTCLYMVMYMVMNKASSIGCRILMSSERVNPKGEFGDASKPWVISFWLIRAFVQV